LTTTWLRRALRDVANIRSLIDDDDPLAAARIVQLLHAAVTQLQSFPSMGRTGRLFGTREFVVSGTPYLIMYRVEGEHLVILRVLHGARRWPPTGRP
jgi:toxin ParE1/3/4